jgi:hypothetical protein
MFLARIWRKPPFKELGYQYGCGEETARRYCEEMTEMFSFHMVPRLVYPRTPAELRAMRRPEVARAFPDLLGILDATNWEQLTPENFLQNRLSYSAYKHKTVFQSLFGGYRWRGQCDALIVIGPAVVSTEKLVLWRSEIFGGISNEISVLLDDSTLLAELKGL